MLLEKIKIKGFKSIKDETINIGGINILIGANGAGKSNFISFFEFLNQLYEQKLEEYVALRGGTNKFLFQGEKIAAFLYEVSKNQTIHYKRTIKTIQSIAPYFSDFYFQPNKEGYIRLQWQSKYSSTL